MDTGDILIQERIKLTGRETTGSLSEVISEKAAHMLPGILKEIAAGKAAGEPQNHSEASYCSLIKKENGILDWNLSAREIDAKIRAYDPWPLCWTTHENQKLYILKAEVFSNEYSAEPAGLVIGIDKKHGILIKTGKGILAVPFLQYQTRKPLEWRDFLNGAKNFIGSRLG
jgi:methionyl-tRNA formyltransferase